MTYPLDIGYAYIPHPDKAHFGGEDAFTVSYRSLDSTYMVAVSDGVGSWLSKRGVSAGPFAADLMMNSEKSFNDGEDDALNILTDAYEATDQIGSATAIIGVLKPRSWGYKVDLIYLGDSSFFVVTDGNMTLQPTEQEIEFNRPFQLGKLAGGLVYAQEPDEGEKFGFNLEYEDMLVLGTDGLFDNLFEDEIMSIISSMENESAANIAEGLAVAAMEKGESLDATPFEKTSRDAGYSHKGGKTDDTTIIVVKAESL